MVQQPLQLLPTPTPPSHPSFLLPHLQYHLRNPRYPQQPRRLLLLNPTFLLPPPSPTTTTPPPPSQNPSPQGKLSRPPLLIPSSLPPLHFLKPSLQQVQQEANPPQPLPPPPSTSTEVVSTPPLSTPLPPQTKTFSMNPSQEWQILPSLSISQPSPSRSSRKRRKVKSTSSTTLVPSSPRPLQLVQHPRSKRLLDLFEFERWRLPFLHPHL